MVICCPAASNKTGSARHVWKRQTKMGKSALKMMAVPTLIFLLVVLNCFFAEAAKKDRCNCRSFSALQKQQMKLILQSEAVNLRNGLQQMCGKRKPAAKWMKITSKPVCFKAKGDQFGSFSVPLEGFVAAIKLVHRSGYLTGNSSSSAYKSKWGCGGRHHGGHHAGHRAGHHGGHHGGHHSHGLLNTYITSSRNSVLFPDDSIEKDPVGGWYSLTDVDANSPVLVLSQFRNPVYVSDSQRLRLWYGEDLFDINEANNGGELCAHVFLWYI